MKRRPGSKQDEKPRQDTTTKRETGNREPGNPEPLADEELRNIVGGLFQFAGVDPLRGGKRQPDVPATPWGVN